MKLSDRPTRRIRVMVHEVESNKMVPGSCLSMAVYDTTSKEVFEIVRGALLIHIAQENGING